ncbi:hypothetical protein ASO20_02155 [Mycoplasma sp. (ex Biomphalaria glabrata)]|uniref:MG284/MPN403 family protein n=1 Tax=Mycoplasma sp. (ex Biomphalaria glabrata) TaxID=1749074 RepID=UPI00073AA41A|nr:hypothetical protein [Mycoplasma sp. (ex Biomphalaria glabrata)]ALV23444.1 hypothetical protein ASO20_02155 [Mycoplasma sp. (ex Biomphalaria glabrata)]
MKYKDTLCQVKQAFYNYELAQIFILSGKQVNINVNSKSLTPEKYVEVINFVIKKLKKEEQRILNNNFLEKDFQNWWCEYYSRSTYYRLSKEAYDNFLNLIKEI